MVKGFVSGERQLLFKPLSYAPGWANYMLKESSRTAEDLRLDRDALVYLDNAARRGAEQAFKEMKCAAQAQI